MHFKLVEGDVDIVFPAQSVDGAVQLIHSDAAVAQFTNIQAQFVVKRAGTKRREIDRATTITDFDRKEVIIPNKAFVTERLINWSLLTLPENVPMVTVSPIRTGRSNRMIRPETKLPKISCRPKPRPTDNAAASQPSS